MRTAVKSFTGGEKKPSGDCQQYISAIPTPLFTETGKIVLCYKFRLITFRKKITDNLN